MPLELIADRPGNAVLHPYQEGTLQPDQVRLKSLFSSVKHGTELRGFRADTPDADDRWDGTLRLHRRGESVADAFPKPLGNICLGEVVEVGAQVDQFAPGDRAFAHLPLRQTHSVAAARLQAAPDGVSPQALMYWDPADFAVGAVQDGPVRLGDRVAVFGLGAIGQMVVQAARLCGARWIAAVDPIERRRQGAQRHGADFPIDPSNTDAGMTIKEQTDGTGADIVFETSGSYRALEDALRSVCYSGTVVSTAYYHGDNGLHLAGEWHRNRINLISSRACSEPLPQFGWNFTRIRTESLALLVEGRLQADDLIDPVVPFGQSAQAYQEINAHPERSIKLGIDHRLQDG
ncbi:MAG: zinc-binding dehydrogenase [Candidatus Latescibacteria bacterium]|nr:zinc-binding dehydrogenase [Candidatus Latescibacterota bacterium]